MVGPPKELFDAARELAAAVEQLQDSSLESSVGIDALAAQMKEQNKIAQADKTDQENVDRLNELVKTTKLGDSEGKAAAFALKQEFKDSNDRLQRAIELGDDETIALEKESQLRILEGAESEENRREAAKATNKQSKLLGNISKGIGGLVGGYAGGRRGSDLFKQAAIQGATAGTLKGISNYSQQRALAKGLEADAAAKATSGSTISKAASTTPTPSDSSFLTSSDYVGPGAEIARSPVITPTGYTDTLGDALAKQNLATSQTLSTTSPNYMEQAKGILAADPTAGTTFNIGEGGISDAAARQQVQASVNRPFTEKLIDSAVSFDDKGGINVLGTAGKLAKAVAPGELAGTAIDMENAMEEAERAEEEAARAQLAQMDYEIDTGFGGQTVIRDPSGVVLPAYLSSQDILDIALGRKARPRLVPGTQFAATRDVATAQQGGGIGSIIYRQQAGSTAVPLDDPAEPLDFIVSPDDEQPVEQEEEIMFMGYPASEISEDVYNLSDEDFESKYNETKIFMIGNLNELGPKIERNERAQGGLVNLAAGGEFSGMVPGNGGGMDDNVFMPIKKDNKQVGTLAVSPTEYVVDSYTMAALGDGNPSEGAKVMDRTVKQIRQKAYGTMKQPNEIDGLQALKPMMRRV